VTHSVRFLPHVDSIVVLKDGNITEMGTYQQLVDQQGEFSQLLATFMTLEKDEDGDEEEKKGLSGEGENEREVTRNDEEKEDKSPKTKQAAR
jgi:ATP-binding cassette subfamily C (CFTR/MRP) protein 1